LVNDGDKTPVPQQWQVYDDHLLSPSKWWFASSHNPEAKCLVQNTAAHSAFFVESFCFFLCHLKWVA